MSRTARLLATILALATVSSLVVLALVHPWFVEVALGADPDASVLVPLQWAAFGVAWALCGLVVVWRTGNRVGWALLGVGLCFGLQWVGWAIWALVRQGESVGEAVQWIGAFLESAWFLGIVLAAVVLPSIFPSGRLTTRLSKIAGGLAVIALIAFAWHLMSHLTKGTYLESFDDQSAVLMFAPLLAGTLGAVLSLAGRFRRSRGVEREQIKWVFAALSAVGVSFFLLFADVPNRLLGPVFGPLMAFTSFGLVPVAIALAILRYRLYDINRIVSRTVAYTLVVAVLLGVFFGLVVMVQTLLPTQDDLAVAASTLAVAALFNPLRRRVQDLVDRRFNRSRFDAQTEIDEMAVRLRGAHDQKAITSEMLGAVASTMQPSSMGVWIRPAGSRPLTPD